MRIVRSVTAVRDIRAALAGRRVGFVPTMGALHAGHQALLVAARDECETVAASIFVNPTQFDDARDLAAYPRTETADSARAREAGVDLLFVPPPEEIYPHGHATTLVIGGAALGFEGDRRPGHFNGVALVCLELFHLVQPDVVYLGQKDAQQVAVLRQLIRDLHLPLKVRVVATVRDEDGLALSSRNARLRPADRARAGAIPDALRRGLAAWQAGSDPAVAARTALVGLEVD